VLAALAVLVATVGIWLRADVVLGASPAFLPAFFTLVLFCDALTTALLLTYYRDGGSPRCVVLAGAYAWSTTIVLVHVLVFPGVLAEQGVIPNAPSSAPWLWAAWHVGLPVLLALGLMPWPERVERWLGEPTDRGRTARLVVGAVVLAALVTGALASFGGDLLPTIIVDGDYSVLTSTYGPWILGLNALALVAGVVGVVRRRGTRLGLETWAVVALLATTCDATLVLLARSRLTVGWYGARALAITAAIVVLMSMLARLSQLHRRLREHAEEATTSNAALREAHALREHMIAVVSHEMRTPLAGLQGFLELLQDHAVGAEQDLIERCTTLTRRLTLLTEDMLTVASDGRSLSLSPEPVDLRGAIEEALSGFHDLDARVHAPERVTVRADPLRLQQVLVNLLRNAQKYGAAPVTLTATADAATGTARVDVHDAGAGVPEEFVDRLFERYARAEGHSVVGSGLGLSVVRDLTRAQGGSVDYLAAEHVFRVMLPLADPDPSAPAPAGDDDTALPSHPMLLG